MGQAAPQAAPSKTSDEQALDVLRLLWAEAYLIGHDDEHGWWAARRGVTGHILTANTPEELGQALGDDFGPGR
jgi:hypothetical protein